MSDFENSDLLKYVLKRLIDISSRKTSYVNAITTMDSSVKDLKEKYDFLRHIEIKNTQYLESDDSITIMADINNIESNELGKALYSIIKKMNKSLGKSAGHFFIKEFRTGMNDDYHSMITDLGIDLSLLQLEFEVEELEKKLKNRK